MLHAFDIINTLKNTALIIILETFNKNRHNIKNIRREYMVNINFPIINMIKKLKLTTCLRNWKRTKNSRKSLKKIQDKSYLQTYMNYNHKPYGFSQRFSY